MKEDIPRSSMIGLIVSQKSAKALAMTAARPQPPSGRPSALAAGDDSRRCDAATRSC